MSLSSDLISQFVKVTKDEEPAKKESIVYGTVHIDGKMYVHLDGAPDELYTPVTTTTDAQDGERVTVLIKNHTATITGNVSSPAARTGTVEEIRSDLTELGEVVAEKVTTKQLEAEVAAIETLLSEKATIVQLEAQKAEVDNLLAEKADIDDLNAANAEIDSLKSNKADISLLESEYATIENLDATNAEVSNLKGTFGDFQELTTENFEAVNADIKNLDTEKLDAESAKVTYANIDFSNIGEAAVKHLFSDYGLIKDIVVEDGTITGELVGVTFKGDLIEGNTIVAEKLVVKGEDGLYYKLNTDGVSVEAEQTEYNSLNGSVITAKSITASKISVSDLVAFDATIGGYKITEGSLYSGVKSSATNTTRGVYMDREGQMAVGDSNNFLRYYKDADGNYKLEISASSILLSTTNKTIEETIADGMDNLVIGARNLIRNSTNLIFKDYRFASDTGADTSAVLNVGVLGAMVLGEG